MRLLAAFLTIPVLAGCAAITGDQWRWMDDPEQQEWVEFSCVGWGREIRFEVPNRRKGSSERVRSYPPIKKGVPSVVMPRCSDFNNTYVLLASFDWDYWWGGFFKDKGTDFSMNVSVEKFEENNEFLSMSADQWGEWRRDYWTMTNSDLDINGTGYVEFFFSDYSIQPHRTKNSMTWVYEDYTTMKGGSIFEFHTPISNLHILSFRFYIKGVRNGMTPDPAWAQRRLEMAHKIMDTVTVTPSPWP